MTPTPVTNATATRASARGTPRHRGCQNFQVDFAYRPSSDDAEVLHGHRGELIAAVFCVRASQTCYTTDPTGTDAVLGS